MGRNVVPVMKIRLADVCGSGAVSKGKRRNRNEENILFMNLANNICQKIDMT